MSNEFSTAESSLSDDQKAVIDYFASPAYHRGTQVSAVAPVQRWTLDALWMGDQRLSPSLSFWLGLAGLNVILLVFAVMMPTALHGVQTTLNRSPGYVATMLLLQTIVFPPIIAFSFATVTPMFWYGSVVVRTLAGAVMVLPACFVFYLTLSFLEGRPVDDFWFGFCGVMFAQFLTVGTVALIVQMWSPWTLSHARAAGTPLPPLGLRAMMELTGVAAVGCAIFLSVDTADILEGLMFFTGVGLLSSVAVIGVMIGFLRSENRSLLAAGISVVCAFATAFMLAAFFAVAEFGWDGLSYDFVLVAAVSLYGTAIICGVMWLCLWWLRNCGWQCVSREDEKRVKEIVTSDPYANRMG